MYPGNDVALQYNESLETLLGNSSERFITENSLSFSASATNASFADSAQTADGKFDFDLILDSNGLVDSLAANKFVMILSAGGTNLSREDTLHFSIVYQYRQSKVQLQGYQSY